MQTKNTNFLERCTNIMKSFRHLTWDYYWNNARYKKLERARQYLQTKKK